jgi:hypothetical protein
MSFVGVLLVSALAVVLLLCVPLSIELAFAGRAEPRLGMSLRWGWFRARSPNPSRRKPKVTAPSKKPRSARRAPSWRRLRALFKSPDFLPSLGRFAARVVRHGRPRGLRLHLRIGLGDPADTGRLWGALAPLLLALSELEFEELRVEPDFLRRSFELDAHAVLRVVPAVLLAFLVGYWFTPAPWRALLRFARA